MLIDSYYSEWIRKAGGLKYTLMSLIRTILSTTEFFKSVFFKNLKMVTYPKNCSPGSDDIILSEKLWRKKPRL